MFQSFNNFRIPKIQFLKFYGANSEEIEPLQELSDMVQKTFFENIIKEEMDNFDEHVLDVKRPIINYVFDKAKAICEKNKCTCYNNYNMNIDFTQSKVNFHKALMDKPFIPKTVFTIEEASKLKFPIIAKPSEGSNGRGIQKFDSYEDLKNSSSKVDLFSEFINFEGEYRALCFKNSPILIYERVPSKENKIIGTKKINEKLSFVYVLQDLKKHDDNVSQIEQIIKELKKCGLESDLFSIDFFIDKKEKLWVIEANSGSGLGGNSASQLYKVIYEDFYGKLPNFINEKIDNIQTKYVDIISKHYKTEYLKSPKRL